YTPKHGHDYPNHHGCTTYLYAKDIAPNPSLSSLIHTRTHTHTYTRAFYCLTTPFHYYHGPRMAISAFQPASDQNLQGSRF
ncbi:hypothetical protein COCCADRAFT_87123, partial [Bipolaris zeicola 26-R-13]